MSKWIDVLDKLPQAERAGSPDSVLVHLDFGGNVYADGFYRESDAAWYQLTEHSSVRITGKTVHRWAEL